MKAIDYIRKGWTQGKFARNAKGEGVFSFSKDAVCWCARGAINATFRENVSEKIKAWQKLKAIIGDVDIFEWNDSPERTHGEVIEVFEKAGI
jgi:hypothetical protein